jgi:hypothetical protein
MAKAEFHHSISQLLYCQRKIDGIVYAIVTREELEGEYGGLIGSDHSQDIGLLDGDGVGIPTVVIAKDLRYLLVKRVKNAFLLSQIPRSSSCFFAIFLTATLTKYKMLTSVPCSTSGRYMVQVSSR